MLQQIIPNIARFSAKYSAVLAQIDDAGERRKPDRDGHSGRLVKRRRILQTRGTQALRFVRKWANQNLGDRLPEQFIAELDAAIESITEHEPRVADLLVVEAAKTLVLDVPYDRLSFQEAAFVACLVSALIEFSCMLTAYRMHELTDRAPGVLADDAVGVVAKSDGTIKGLISLLTQIFRSNDHALGAPADLSSSELRSLLTDDLQNADLPIFSLALWTATHAHYTSLSSAIREAVALLSTNQAWNFDDTQQSHLNN